RCRQRCSFESESSRPGCIDLGPCGSIFDRLTVEPCSGLRIHTRRSLSPARGGHRSYRWLACEESNKTTVIRQIPISHSHPSILCADNPILLIPTEYQTWRGERTTCYGTLDLLSIGVSIYCCGGIPF